MQNSRHYHTMADAIGAMSLDVGYNPFAVGQVVRGANGQMYRRPTKVALAALGYPVDAVLAAAEKTHRDQSAHEYEQRQTEANAAYDAAVLAVEQRAQIATADATILRQALDSPTTPLPPAELSIYGDPAGRHTCIVLLSDRRIILDRDGDTVIASHIAPIQLSETQVLRSSGIARRIHLERRHDDKTPVLAYLLHLRLASREFWRLVPVQGGNNTDYDTREHAIHAACATASKE